MGNPRQSIPLSFTVGHAPSPSEPPPEFVPATVPGAVQLDWARAKEWGPWWYADHFKDYRWMEDRYWTYRAFLPEPLPSEGSLFLVLEGVDYACEVRIDGARIHAHEGANVKAEIPLDGRCMAGSLLEIVVFPAPKSRPQPEDRSQADHSVKPAVSYGWDFHPRLIPLGLWGAATLESRPVRHLLSTDIDLILSDSFEAAAIEFTFEQVEAGLVRFLLFDPDGKAIFERKKDLPEHDRISFGLKKPRLWWPSGMGEPVLYTWTFEILGDSGEIIDRAQGRIGFRRLRLVMGEGSWNEPSRFPKSRSAAPMTVEINGKRIFAKGANWVLPDVFPGSLGAQRYREQVDLAADCHFNLLRMWGGSQAPHDAFYDRCDERGILVWQEFPLACNRYPDDQAYLDALDHDSRHLIRRLKPHACLAWWGGGNELFNRWSGMDDQSHALRLLNRNTFEFDRQRPFLATAPLTGMGHGHYRFRDGQTREECWAIFQRSSCTAYSEFGIGSISNLDVLDAFLPEPFRFPPNPGTPWQTHHAFKAWEQDSHLYLPDIAHYWGACASLPELVEKGQRMAADGMRGLFEEARRQKPLASMALAWCFNEPWPTAANCSLVNWPCKPKASLQAVAQALRPVLASARIRKYRWSPGEVFDPELWLLSDSPRTTGSGRMIATLTLGDLECARLEWSFKSAEPSMNTQGPRLQCLLPAIGVDNLLLSLQVEGHPDWDSSWKLPFGPPTPTEAFQPSTKA